MGGALNCGAIDLDECVGCGGGFSPHQPRWHTCKGPVHTGCRNGEKLLPISETVYIRATTSEHGDQCPIFSIGNGCLQRVVAVCQEHTDIFVRLLALGATVA